MGKEQELFRAAKTGDLRTLERLLGQQSRRASVMGSMRKSLHPNQQDDLGYTLLHHATLNGHREVVSFLLRCSASTTIPDCSGSYPLHLASWKGDMEIVKLLVQQGPSRANVNQLNNNDDTGLHLAAQYGYCGVVEFLLERHANAMMKNVRGETPLDLAAQFGHLDTVHVIISYCPEILRLSRPNISPLHLAARNGHSLVVLSLINAGASVNTVCKSGSALHEASRCGKEDTVKLLLDKGIDVNLKDDNGKTALGMLSDFPARQARVIHRLISDYIDARRKPTARYMKPRSYRLLAVPIRDGSGVTTGDMPILKYREGEAILIQSRYSSSQWVGTLNDKTGLFSISDTRLYQDINGRLHQVAMEQITISEEDGSILVAQGSPGPIRKSIVGGEDERMVVQHSPAKAAHSQKKSKKKKSKMSDEQKRFVLSRDTGAYSQLNPVSAQEASSSDQVEVKELHSPKDNDTTTISKQQQPSTGYIGNYYLLDLENFADQNEKKEEEPQAVVPRPNRPAYENVTLTLSSADPLDVSVERHHPEAQLTDTPTSRQEGARSSSPISIPTTTSPSQQRRRRSQGTENHAPTGKDDGKQFRIADKDDVMVSKMNPNYEQVELRRKQQPPPSDQQQRAAPPSEEVQIISSDDNPFAGLVQSSSDHSDGFPAAAIARNRLQSVWDDRRVDKEWNQIDDLLKDMTGDINTATHSLPPPLTNPHQQHDTTVPTADDTGGSVAHHSSVSLWLRGVGLAGYSSTLETNGFDHLHYIGGGILAMDDLTDIGITDQGDQYAIMAAANLLPAPPLVRHASSVSEWLQLLHLSSLEDKFSEYSLDKITTLWDIQLTTLLGVELLGHRKRLQYGIKELSSNHLTARHKLKHAHMTSSPVLGFKFTQDYTNLQSARKSSSDISTATQSLAVPMVASIRKGNRPVSSPVHLPGPVLGRVTSVVSPGHSVPPPTTTHRNYHTWYLGSGIVKGPPGKHSAEEACLRLKTKTDGIAKIPQIILSISWKGVRFVDASSKRVVSTHYIQDISHCCSDIEDGRVFAYMTKEKETAHSYCHVFMVQSKDIADEIILTVGQAFEVAYQAVIKARATTNTVDHHLSCDVDHSTSTTSVSYNTVTSSS